MSKAMDSFWKTTSATDAYQKQLISMRKNIESTKQKIDELRKSNRQLANDILDAEVRLADAKRFNQIAVKYGDVARAQATQADIAKAQLEIDEKKSEIAKNSREADSLQRGMYALRGYSEAAIENRAALKALQGTMVEMIEAYAAQGHSTQQVERYTQQLKREFINQATQMGFNRGEVNVLAGAFDGLSRSIINTPREAKVKATDHGTVNSTQRQIDGIHGHSVQMPVHADTTPFYNAINNASNYAAAKIGSLGLRRSSGSSGWNSYVRRARNPPGPWRGGYRGFARGGKIPGRTSAPTTVDNLVAATPNREIFGIRSGEWVMNARAVAKYGDGFMKAVNERRYNPAPAVSVEPSQAGNGAVDLTPRTINAIGRAVSTQVSIGDRAVANAANSATSSYNNRGGF